jgi:hypothetical protein
MAVYLILCVWFGITSYARGWGFLSGFLVSLLLTPITGLIFNAIRGANMYNERGRNWLMNHASADEAHRWDDSPSPDKFWQNQSVQNQQQQNRVEDPWEEDDDIAERRRRDFYRDRGQIKDNY